MEEEKVASSNNECLKDSKEQERERRRVRDRQRRQSMTVEEREKHLARRRRNYQLRRQRAASNHLSFPNPVPDPLQESPAAVNSAKLDEVPRRELATLTRRIRLSHIKRLARTGSLDKDRISFVENQGNSSRKRGIYTVEGDKSVAAKGLQLRRVKQLARAKDTDLKKECWSKASTENEK